MDWRDQVIGNVGRSMGMDDLNFSGSGVIKLTFERGGDLFIEAKDSGVLFYQTRMISRHDCLETLLVALKSCHYSQSMKHPLQVGLQGEEGLVLCSFLANESFSEPNIQGLMQMMGEQFDKITAAS
ncbi:hypothetical protein [Candidatus Sororendozoicomonas aggregata]|uniref:hypothetical protein n=1 Tax=Candidatus Sororendozoicomonas aggregata TaxID=3073239 RepID=UPI002ED5888B